VVEKKKKDACPWCQYNNHQCTTAELKKNCDFRTLAYNEDAIIERMQQEMIHLKADQTALKSRASEEGVRLMLDRVAGMQIMMSRLQEDFGMSEEEIRKKVGWEKKSTVEKAKVAAMLGMLKKTRGR
jgi:hypothetical protein